MVNLWEEIYIRVLALGVIAAILLVGVIGCGQRTDTTEVYNDESLASVYDPHQYAYEEMNGAYAEYDDTALNDSEATDSESEQWFDEYTFSNIRF